MSCVYHKVKEIKDLVINRDLIHNRIRDSFRRLPGCLSIVTRSIFHPSKLGSPNRDLILFSFASAGAFLQIVLDVRNGLATLIQSQKIIA